MAHRSGGGDDDEDDCCCYFSILLSPGHSTYDQLTLKSSSLLCSDQGWLKAKITKEEKVRFSKSVSTLMYLVSLCWFPRLPSAGLQPVSS